jgi:hypothetical protein
MVRAKERKLMRQPPLIDEFDPVGPGIEGDGAIMAAPAAHGDLHGR